MEDTVLEIVLFLSTCVFLIITYVNNAHTYWEKKGVATIRPHFLLGTLSKRFYDNFKARGEKFGGVYLVTSPTLVIVHPDYIKDILVKDFHHFVDRGVYHNKKDDPLSAHLFSIDGQDWKNMRRKLTPTFTSGKMKMMFHSMVECCGYMKDAIEARPGEDFHIKEFLGRFTTDVIGSCAFGIECNSFKYPNAEFRRMGKRIFEYEIVKAFRAFFLMNLPKMSLQLGFKHTTKDVRKFFCTIVADTVKLRKEKNVRRNDFLQLLIDIKDDSGLTLEEMAAQVFLFFIAGFETSATTMTFGLYEVARNSEVQKKLREEVNEVVRKYNGEIAYEALAEMKYLEQVIEETLRMYPPVTTINRRCTKDYTLRDTNINIPKGTPILISTLGLHMDPEFYPQSEKFDPGRFAEETKKKNKHSFVYLPFGEGPRNCIGQRFGLMQSKIGIATMVQNFEWSVSPATKPVEFHSTMFLLNFLHPVYLRGRKL